MKKVLGFLTILILLSHSPINADIFTWTDANGVKHYTNEMPQDSQDATHHDEYQEDQEVYQKSTVDRQRKQDEMTGKVPAGTDIRVTKNPGEVVFFSQTKNSECDNAREFFKEFKIPYTEHNIDKEPDAKKYIERLGNRLPTIFVGGRQHRFFDQTVFRGLFGITEKQSVKIKSTVVKDKGHVTINPGNVVLYTETRNWKCDKPRFFFTLYKIPFTEFNVDKDEKAKKYIAQMGTPLPTILVGGKLYKTFDENEFKRLFGIVSSKKN